jgi:hypothetical protein
MSLNWHILGLIFALLMKYIETESIKNVLNDKTENIASVVLLSLFMGRYCKLQATEYINCTNIKYN